MGKVNIVNDVPKFKCKCCMFSWVNLTKENSFKLKKKKCNILNDILNKINYLQSDDTPNSFKHNINIYIK